MLRNRFTPETFGTAGTDRSETATFIIKRREPYLKAETQHSLGNHVPRKNRFPPDLFRPQIAHCVEIAALFGIETNIATAWFVAKAAVNIQSYQQLMLVRCHLTRGGADS